MLSSLPLLHPAPTAGEQLAAGVGRCLKMEFSYYPSQQEISADLLAREIIDQINPTATIVSDDIRIRPEKSEVVRLLGSNEKIRRLTGWQPEYTLQ